MTRTALVNYHVHKSYRQAFELDAGGVAGNLISPELAATSVVLSDNRTTTSPVSFASDAVEIVSLETQVRDFAGDSWEPVYDTEI
ncbi:hypothetical protein [Ruegeria atlantica]|uniref:Uncharacterized protein n=1 Tax=Ruegeria atlantica TaxID=81569 RepID=A0A0P1EXN7_9RHOB|nr:hypothetical protein [Ruegeria atlantica]CUH46559.1 hypothetical protein RUA4292_00725 [Ruegeria atlantica]